MLLRVETRAPLFPREAWLQERPRLHSGIPSAAPGYQEGCEALGRMFWFMRKKLLGSYLPLISARRSRLGP